MRMNVAVLAPMTLATQLVSAHAPTAPAKPDFLGPNGATFSLSGSSYTIKIGQVLKTQAS